MRLNKGMRFFMVAMVLPLMVGCVPPPRTTTTRRQAPQPCRAHVEPIRNQNIILVINYNYAYSAKDPVGGREWHKGDIISHLNDLGRGDGNSFAESNGQPVNFYLTYSLNNDGQDHFTGSVTLSGWGWGNINTIYLGQYPYASSAKLTSDLTDKFYEFIHGGWHDLNPKCPQY